MVQPFAACALLLRNQGREVLAVSRKNDRTDFGLPGGKVEPGETPQQACLRELKEETGLEGEGLEEVYTGPCMGRPATTYEVIHTLTETLQSKEQGLVAWVPRPQLDHGSFGAYNTALFQACHLAPMQAYHISGHLNVSDAEFEKHYAERIRQGAAEGAYFVVGDARGADHLAQKFLKTLGYKDVMVYHMFDRPRHNEGFKTVGGFTSDEERDAAMTAATYEDLAWVRPGRESSGTAKNLARRKKTQSF